MFNTAADSALVTASTDEYLSRLSSRYLDGDGATDEEVEFNWEEHLEETGGEAVPHTAFKHVRPAHFLILDRSYRLSRQLSDPLNMALAWSNPLTTQWRGEGRAPNTKGIRIGDSRWHAVREPWRTSGQACLQTLGISGTFKC